MLFSFKHSSLSSSSIHFGPIHKGLVVAPQWCQITFFNFFFKGNTVIHPNYSETVMGNNHWEDGDKAGERQDRELCSQTAQERHKASVAIIQWRQTARFVCHIVLCGGWLLFYSFLWVIGTMSALAILFPQLPLSSLSLFPSLKRPRTINS